MTDQERAELLERVAEILLVQMVVDGVSKTTRMLLDLHGYLTGDDDEYSRAMALILERDD